MQALISVFIDDGDKLRCINAGRTRITFLLRSPLYYACVSSWGEPESVVSDDTIRGRCLETTYLCEGRHDSILNTCTCKYSVWFPRSNCDACFNVEITSTCDACSVVRSCIRCLDPEHVPDAEQARNRYCIHYLAGSSGISRWRRLPCIV